MRTLSNERGVALVTALLLTLISLAIVLSALYFVTQQTQLSGASKRYKNVLDATHGGVEVYTKEIKGALAVRKLVVGRRPPTAGAFPYVIFWTDFSAGRKTPLEVSTLYAHTENRAEALARKLLEENITKGFERTDGPKTAAAAPAEPEEPKPKKKATRKKAD